MAGWRNGILTALACAGLLAGTSAGARETGDEIYSFEDRALDRVTATGLETFASDRELAAYLRRVKSIRNARSKRWVGSLPQRIQYAQADVPCVPGNPDCPVAEDANIIVTAQRASGPQSITNNQTAGVDEGDIVKQIGPFLLILQDGRIFSVDTRNGLKLADRIDVYRNPHSDTWYDEMLVQDDHVLINAYSYEEQATELSIFAIDRATGRLTAEGVFLITSDDYYDVGNYATRIVGDRLVVYTPYDPDSLLDRDDRPMVRRWLPKAERNAANEAAGGERIGRRLFDARSVYRPVQRTSQPVIHSLSVCRLGAWQPGDDLDCRVTAFVGPEYAQMFVAPGEIYLWLWPGREELGWQDCDDLDPALPARGRAARSDVIPSAIFRLPLRGGDPGVVGVSGQPFDQFSMDSRDGTFRALDHWRAIRCGADEDERAPDVAFLNLHWSAFGSDFIAAPDARFTPLPSANKRIVENRFADDWLVYGGRDSWRGSPPHADDGPQETTVVAVPVAHPERAISLTLPHNIVRTERVGNDIMLDGYRDAKGLTVSLLTLDAAPRLASSVTLPHRFESEGRSHAFNSITDAHGNGVMGIPTVLREGDPDRWWWRSAASDLSFLTVTGAGALRDAGEIKTRSGSEEGDANDAEDRAKDANGYSCEVSCVDWYGNSRPIFTDGRIFGLMGTEIVEARLGASGIEEISRLDMTQRVARH